MCISIANDNFLLQSRKMCLADTKKDAASSAIIRLFWKQMRWLTLTINKVAWTRFGTSVVLSWKESIWEGLTVKGFKFSHDFKNTPKTKFQFKWSFRICYHNLPNALVISPLLPEITNFLNKKVRQLADLTYSLSTPDIEYFCRS